MKCLYCGKTINANNTESGWHKSCVKKFFGTEKLPEVDISSVKLEELANETVNKGLTVPGVQKKLSLHLSDDPQARLTVVDYLTGYILKPQTDEYEYLPEFEYLAMGMAKAAGISTVPNALIENDGQYAYITKRVDRINPDDNGKFMLAMEDFCQLSERLTSDKYKGSYEKCSKIINDYSSRAGLDMTELFIRVVFAFVIGNSDMHLKNFSLIESSPGSREFCLSPAYDILPVNVIIPEDKEQMALTLNGKKSNFKRRDFMNFAKACSISDDAASKMISRICSLKDTYLKMCEESYLPEEWKGKMEELINKRIDILTE